MNTIEHEIWCPISGSTGINNQKIAIVGYSHHFLDRDSNSVTTEVLRDYISGKESESFFTKIQGYFGYSDRREFWNHVYFFNFLSKCIGDGTKKYETGTDEDHKDARNRLHRILEKEAIEKIFVFTTKGWRAFPYTVEEVSSQRCNSLFEGQRNPSWGHYRLGDRTVLACGFKHPQYAKSDIMKIAVEKFLCEVNSPISTP
jgi:hypothetical protein